MASVRAATKTFKKLTGTDVVEEILLAMGFTAPGFDSSRGIPNWASTDATSAACAEPLPFVLLTTLKNGYNARP